MRRILVASLLLAPVSFATMMLSTAAVASTPATPTKTPQTFRISTGVTPPRVIESVKVELSSDTLTRGFYNNSQVVVSVLVGVDGKAQDIHVTKPLQKTIDDQVVAAVRQFRFAPATLDNQAVPMALNLTLILER